MRVEIDHKLRIARSELPSDVEDLILDALSIPNAERQKQMEQGISGWKSLPERINLWKIEDNLNTIVAPRGFLDMLETGLDAMGVKAHFEDNTVFNDDLPWMASKHDLIPRKWQARAVQDIINEEQGIWKAPAGSGKTVGILDAIRCLNCPSIVLVNTKDILYQWVDRAKRFLGSSYPVSIIGDGQFSISDYLTIATAQTLNSRFNELEAQGFFEEFGFMCLDECHHATAETYSKIVSRFSSRYRIGVSATPDKTGDFALAQAVLGPIIHETKREDVDTLVEPIIYRIPTAYKYKYRGRMGNIPSNYPQLLQDLITNDDRNALIIATLFLNKHRHNLVCSKRLDHLRILGDLLTKYEYPHPVLYLTGSETSDVRKAVIDYASMRPCVILSTLADEALDIPRLDGLFLIFPQRSAGLIEQQVGRIAREHPGKQDAAVFDFCDSVGPLEAQWQSRRREVYVKHGYEIITVTPREIEKGLRGEW